MKGRISQRIPWSPTGLDEKSRMKIRCITGFLGMVSTCDAPRETHGRRKGTLTAGRQQGPWKRLLPNLCICKPFNCLSSPIALSLSGAIALQFSFCRPQGEACDYAQISEIFLKIFPVQRREKSEAGNQQTGFVFTECSFTLYRGDQSG